MDFIYNSCKSGHKIILLDETGKDNSIFIGIIFLMKFYNLNFDTIYNSLSNYINIHPKEYYYPILSIEHFIIKNSNVNYQYVGQYEKKSNAMIIR
jgi:hypothetical protein